MPNFRILDFKCTNGACGFFNEVKEFTVEGSEIPICICEEPMEKAISAHAGYKIRGNNSASQRPKQAGSYRRRK